MVNYYSERFLFSNHLIRSKEELLSGASGRKRSNVKKFETHFCKKKVRKGEEGRQSKSLFNLVPDFKLLSQSVILSSSLPLRRFFELFSHPRFCPFYSNLFDLHNFRPFFRPTFISHKMTRIETKEREDSGE